MATDLLGQLDVDSSPASGLSARRFSEVNASIFRLVLLALLACLSLAMVGCDSSSEEAQNQVIEVDGDGGFRVLPDPVDSGIVADPDDAGDQPDDPTPLTDGGFPQSDGGWVPWDAGDPVEPTFTPLSILSATPSRGSVLGGVSVGLTGTGFFRSFTDAGATAAKRATEVFIGDQPAADFTIINDLAMEVVVPASEVTGAVDVVVKNPSGEARCTGCFFFYRPLSLEQITPASGAISGGEWVRLSGTGLSGDTQVFFDKSPASQVMVSGDEERSLLALTPPGTAVGRVDVEAFGEGGVSVLANAFTYEPIAAIAAISPSFVPLAGGEVTLVGTALTQATELYVGNASVEFAPLSDEAIGFTAPPQTAPVCVPVALKFASGASVVGPHDLCWTDDSTTSSLVLAGLIPTHAPSAGGAQITLFGSGLSQVARLQLADAVVDADDFVAQSDGAVAFSLPLGQPGRVSDVVALDASGNELTRLQSAFFYEPEVSAVSPQVGEAGDEITIVGSGFLEDGVFDVRFGAQASPHVTRVSDSELLAVVPAGRGAVDVTVQTQVASASDRTPSFAVTQVLPRGFAYETGLAILTLTPDSGTIAGGDHVTILGAGFGPKTSFRIGQALIKDLTVVDESHATGRIPSGSSGYADVVALDGGKSAVLSGGYFYRSSSSSSAGGSSGPVISGTLNVTVSASLNSARLEGVIVSAFVHSDANSSGRGNLVARGTTDAEGMITLQSPAMNRPVQVVFQRDGFRTLEVVGQASRNLSVFLTQVAATGSDSGASLGSITSGGINVTEGQVEETVSELPSGSTAAGGGTSSPTFESGAEIAVISGTVSGFKVTRQLLPEEIPMAKVSVVPTSFYSTPPFSSSSSDMIRDLLGERWKVTSDGGPFTIYGKDGLQTVYAIFGIYNVQTGAFEPSLMGMARNVSSLPTSPASNVDIVLDIHLNASVDVQILESSAISNDGSSEVALTESSQPSVPPTLSAYGWISLGNDGYIPLESASSMDGLTLKQLPTLSLGNFLFLGRSEAGDGAASSTCFHRSEGMLSQGVLIGPMVAKNRALPPNREESIVVPSENKDEPTLRIYGFDGTLRWQQVEGTPGDIQRLFIRVTHGETGIQEQVEAILPGDQRALELNSLLSAPIDAAQDEIFVEFTTSRAPTFDYDFWGYTHFNTSSLSCWADGFFRPVLREVISEDELDETGDEASAEGGVDL